MTTTQAKFSTDTDKPKVAKVTIRTSNVNPGPFAANASNTEFNEPGVYLTLESGSSIDSADQFVLYYIVGGSQERYPKLVVNGQTQANNQLIEGAPYSGANNVYYFTLNGKVPSDMANLAVIEKIAFRPAAAAPGTDWSMLDSDNIPFVYESSDE